MTRRGKGKSHPVSDSEEVSVLLFLAERRGGLYLYDTGPGIRAGTTSVGAVRKMEGIPSWVRSVSSHVVGSPSDGQLAWRGAGFKDFTVR